MAAAKSGRGRIPASAGSHRSGAVRSTAAETATLTRKPARPKKATPIHFPITISMRRAGFSSKGSSDCRSRSPATVSMATFMPPTNAATRVKMDIIAPITAASDPTLESDTSPTTTGPIRA